jgi:glycosyltransferase involved in cell wall biosynthesis
MKVNSIGVFMSYRTTFEQWSEIGLADREFHYYKELSKKGYKIILFTYGGKNDEKIFKKYKKFQDINFTIMPMCKNSFFPFTRIGTLFTVILFILQNRAILSKLNFVKTKQMSGAWVALLVSKLYKAKFIFRFGYNLLEFDKLKKIFLLRRLWNTLLVNIYFKSCYIIIGTAWIKDFEYNSKFVLQENWIDTNSFSTDKDIRYKQLKKNRKYLTIGRLEKQKNHLLAIKVLGKLKKKLSIIGEGSQFSFLNNFVKKNKFNIKLLGQLKYHEVIKNCKSHTFYISSSKFEGNPKSIIEAMAAGMICILPNVEGVSNLVTNKVNGYVYDLNEQSLENLIIKINKSPIKTLNKISQKASTLARKRFNIQSALRKEQDIYAK